MNKITLYLDVRKPLVDGSYSIKIRISIKGLGHLLIPTGISTLSKLWAKDQIIGKNSIHQNTLLKYRTNKVETEMVDLELSGRLESMSLPELKAHLLSLVSSASISTGVHLVKDHFEEFISYKTKRSTIESYQQTLHKIELFTDITTLQFEHMNLKWLKDFDRHMRESGLSINTIAIYMRKSRSIFNNAINEEVVNQNLYPFRKFKIKSESTIKRSLSIEQLRLIHSYPVEQHQERYRDTFMLIFYLIGINIVDLCAIKQIDHAGRVTFHRAKTNKLYSIKIEPEALAIIEKYKGKNQLLNFSDIYANHKDYMRRVNRGLQSIGETTILKHGKKERKPIFTELTTYWARHTWATIAADLDVPDETISLALGHSGANTTTNIYINRNMRKVDEANRRVIDYLLEKRAL